jgi:NAD(P)-dependent dehydrogenase (short-subunit alcohol dehydrogenase family)
MLQLDDRVALITGAASGMGQAAALLLAKEGAKIGVLDLSAEDVQETVDKINNSGGQAIPLIADVSQPDQMQQAATQLADKWGRIDIVFANAGVNGVWAPLDELEPDEWDRTLAINLKGTFLSVKYALPYLKKRGGAVVVTSSVNGTRIFSSTGATAYSCSKAAQVTFTKMMALELAKHRIRVNVICPGAIQTNISENSELRNIEREKEPVEFPEGDIPLTDGEVATAHQVAQLVLFLVSDASNFISGSEVWIDGAQSLLMG